MVMTSPGISFSPGCNYLQQRSSTNMAEYARFPSLPDNAKHEDGSPALNRHSTFITRGHDFPAAKVRQPLPCIPIERHLTPPGYAVWRRSPQPRGNGKEPTCRHWICLVGRKPVQHAPVGPGKDGEKGSAGAGDDRLAIQYHRGIGWDNSGPRG